LGNNGREIFVNFYQSKGAAVPATPTKYDDCVLRATGKPYRFQKGSGRSEILNNWAQDGRTIRELVAIAAEHGYDPVFTVGAVFRQHDTKDGAWIIEPPEGTTLEQIKGNRQERTMTPEQLEKKAAREAEKAARIEAREARKAEAALKREEREREKAARAEATAARRAEASLEGETAAVTAAADDTGGGPVKGRRGRKPRADAAPSGEAPAAEAAA
jgi:hypothetical protein